MIDKEDQLIFREFMTTSAQFANDLVELGLEFVCLRSLQNELICSLWCMALPEIIAATHHLIWELLPDLTVVYIQDGESI